MCGFTWRELKAGQYELIVTQNTGPLAGVLESKQEITVISQQ